MIKPNSRSVRAGIRIVLSWGAALGTGFIFSSCKPGGERIEITETRNVSKFTRPPDAGLSTAERFGEKSPLTWIVPDGWVDAGKDSSPGGMRLINLRFGSGGEGECYLAAMPGPAGGLEANINRWRGQMGKPELSADELAKLPKKPFLNREATYVSIDGDFKGVGVSEAAKDYRLVGLVQPAPEFTLFVKMTGPKELVEKNEAAFDEFVQSISANR